MKKGFFRLFLASVLSLTYLLMAASIPVSAIELTEQQTLHNSDVNVATNMNSYRAAQRININSTTITKLGFWLRKTQGAGGYPTNGITFAIWSSENDSVIESKAWGTAEALSTSFTYCEVEFDSPILIDGNVRIGVTASATGGTKGYIIAGNYDGDVKSSENFSWYSGSSWADYPVIDLGYVYAYEGNVTSPEVQTFDATNITLDSDFPWNFDATFHGNVIDDGNQACTVAFYYKDTEESSWHYVGIFGTYETGDNFTATVNILDAGKNYQVYAAIENDAAQIDGNIVNFYTSAGVAIPSVLTLSYPIIIGSENVTIYGQILDDGSSNCSGWFDYRIKGNSGWEYSTNATKTDDLMSTDGFNQFIDGLTENTTYEFIAVAENDEGIGYGAIAEFTLEQEMSAPTMETGNYLATDVSAALMGFVVSHNGAGVLPVYFEYRRQGVLTWQYSVYKFIAENSTGYFTVQIDGLSSNTTYEYRAVGFNTSFSTTPPTLYYGHGETKIFFTSTSVSIPVMVTGNCTFIDSNSVKLIGELVFDGGSPVTAWFQIRKQGNATWIESEYIYPLTTGYEIETIIHNLETGEKYEYRIVGVNNTGTGYGLTRIFAMGEGGLTTGKDMIDTFNDFINNLQRSLHLTGTMGTWAFLVFLELIIALIFGVAMVSVRNERGLLLPIGIVWTIISIAISGAFIFTGKLGIYPILMLVVVFAIIVIAVISKWVNGGSNINA